jgi:hypothetical protein
MWIRKRIAVSLWLLREQIIYLSRENYKAVYKPLQANFVVKWSVGWIAKYFKKGDYSCRSNHPVQLTHYCLDDLFRDQWQENIKRRWFFFQAHQGELAQMANWHA